jgi:hypothetical protein
MMNDQFFWPWYKFKTLPHYVVYLGLLTLAFLTAG